MAKQSMVIFNRAHSGYRRAGIVFNKGDNVVEDLTKAQIQQITNDKRLVLQDAPEAEPTEEKNLVGNDNELREGVTADSDVAGDNDTAPEVPELVEVINSLAIDGLLQLTQSGKPEVAQLEAASQKEVSAAERDAAWDFYNKNLVEGNA